MGPRWSHSLSSPPMDEAWTGFSVTYLTLLKRIALAKTIMLFLWNNILLAQVTVSDSSIKNLKTIKLLK